MKSTREATIDIFAKHLKALRNFREKHPGLNRIEDPTTAGLTLDVDAEIARVEVHLNKLRKWTEFRECATCGTKFKTNWCDHWYCQPKCLLQHMLEYHDFRQRKQVPPQRLMHLCDQNLDKYYVKIYVKSVCPPANCPGLTNWARKWKDRAIEAICMEGAFYPLGEARRDLLDVDKGDFFLTPDAAEVL